jgi:tripartite-type tricarboxylate transporter receptor subunit TctC
MDTDIPDFGDPDGLARLVERAIESFDRMGLPDEQRQAWIEEIEAALETAAGAWRGDCLPQLDFDDIFFQSK